MSASCPWAWGLRAQAEPTHADVIAELQKTQGKWRRQKLSRIENRELPDGTVAVRDSKTPEARTVLFTPAEMAAWINGCKAGEFNDLARTKERRT